MRTSTESVKVGIAPRNCAVPLANSETNRSVM
jgi:hypothetical protein